MALGRGISRLPDLEGDRPARKRSKADPHGFVHMDIAEVRTGAGKLSLFVAVDRTSRFALARLVDEATRPPAFRFPDEPLEVVPCRSHPPLTANGVQSAPPLRDRNAIPSRPSRFDMIRAASGSEHRPNEPHRPWTSGRVARTNRTIEPAATERYRCDGPHRSVPARRLMTHDGLTPAQDIWA